MEQTKDDEAKRGDVELIKHQCGTCGKKLEKWNDKCDCPEPEIVERAEFPNG